MNVEMILKFRSEIDVGNLTDCNLQEILNTPPFLIDNPKLRDIRKQMIKIMGYDPNDKWNEIVPVKL